jgi:hypothetical protein
MIHTDADEGDTMMFDHERDEVFDNGIGEIIIPEAPAHIREEAWAWESGFEAGWRAASQIFDLELCEAREYGECIYTLAHIDGLPVKRPPWFVLDGGVEIGEEE